MTEALRVIGLMGKSKSGKDTVGAMLRDVEPAGATLAFADKLKEVCMDLFGLSHDDCYTEAGKARKLALPCPVCPACGSIDTFVEVPGSVVCRSCTAVGEDKAFASSWTPRMILQFIGTEGARRVDKDVWVKHAIARAINLLSPTAVRKSGQRPAKFVAITDCRFKSEMAAIVVAGGEVWRIRRPETDSRGQGIAGHQSETEMDTIPDSEFSAVINNDATLEVLAERVRQQYQRYVAQFA